MASREWIPEFLKLISTKEADNLQLAYAMKAHHIPSSLFRYRRIDDYSLENLKNSIFYLSEPQNFNDPKDSSLSFNAEILRQQLMRLNFEKFVEKHNLKSEFSNEDLKLIKEFDDPIKGMIEIYTKQFPERAEYFDSLYNELTQTVDIWGEEMVNQFNTGYKSKLRVCCFCEENNTTMWAHYAADQKGFAIEYDFKALMSSDLNKRFLYPVIYTKSLFDGTDFLKPEKLNPYYSLFASLYKAEIWSYEKEWRLVYPFGLITNNLLPSPKPKAVYLGAKMTSENKLTVFNLSVDLGIPIFEITYPSTSYDLKVQPYLV